MERRNWHLPKWPAWPRRVSHEPPAAVAAATASPAVGGPGVLVMEEINDGDRVRLRLQGELDLVTAKWLAARLSKIEAGRPAVLVIDLRGLTFMDSSGLRELFAANRRAREDDRRVALVKGSDPIDRVLEMVRADDAMETVNDPADVS